MKRVHLRDSSTAVESRPRRLPAGCIGHSSTGVR
jgi:hypothetical protein